MNATSPYLRPMFTQRIAQRLADGDTIIIIGDEKQGAKRLLDDLSTFDVHLIRIDFPSSASYQSLLDSWTKQLYIKDQIDDPSIIVEAMKLQGGNWWFLWDQIDQMPTLTELQRADLHAAIQEVAIIPTLGFIATSSQMQEATDWAATIQKLPPLAYSRIREEFHRKVPDISVPSSFINAVFSHSHSYLYLEFLSQKIVHLNPSTSTDMDSYLNEWQQEFHQQFHLPIANISHEPKGWWDSLKNSLKRKFF